MSAGNDYELISKMAKYARKGSITGESLVAGNEAPVFEKYDDYIPPQLLRHAYATDKMNTDEAIQRVFDIESEF